MIKSSILVDDAINLLNEMYKADPEATTALVEARVSCNDELAKHPTVQVTGKDGKFKVGLLGVINGVFGTDDRGWGPIAAYFDDDGKLTGFKRASK